METKMKTKGFTLIELLVVIVIIGILATISVATFSGYFKRARDAERQAAVREASTTLASARSLDVIKSYNDTTNVATKEKIEEILKSQAGYQLPAPSTAGFNYIYVYNTGDPESYAIFTCSEQNPGTAIVQGTVDAVNAIKDNEDTLCLESGVKSSINASNDIGTNYAIVDLSS